LNGVEQALGFGVPVIAGGVTEDKPMVTARVAWTGAGINLMTGTPAPEQIRAAVCDILRNYKYRECAQKMAKSLSQYDALDTITKIVEATIAKGTPAVSN
jgi:UDP:flavonoid glycosyltransferase YjiC (YdhE family)